MQCEICSIIDTLNNVTISYPLFDNFDGYGIKFDKYLKSFTKPGVYILYYPSLFYEWES